MMRLDSKTQAIKRLKAIGLFAGAGGVTGGVRAAGIVVIAALDSHQRSGHTYRANDGQIPRYRDVIDAADFGVPQRRRRLVLIALRGVPDRLVPAITPDDKDLRVFATKRTVRQAFAEVEGLGTDLLHKPRWNYPDRVRERIQAIP